MIASLSGEVIAIALDHAVIECAGVGYMFLATPRTLSQLRRGDSARVLTHLAVKEDAMTLYGFSSGEDREMFQTLQSVSGLGPKLALAALSVMDAGELAAAIAGGDAKTLQKIPGVGKRMAERMALELKDKVAGFAQAASASDAPVAAAAVPASAAVIVDQVTEALTGLGFTDKQARPVVEAVAAESAAGEAGEDATGAVVDTAALLRAALAQLGRKK